MRSNCRIHRNKCRSRIGTTLLEVLLGLAILATLLASVIVARGRFIRQWADADRRLRMIDAADRLMGQLSNDSPEQLDHASGSIPELADCQWQTHLLNDASAAAIGAYKFQLQMVDTRNSFAPVRVEFLIHNRRATTAPARSS